MAKTAPDIKQGGLTKKALSLEKREQFIARMGKQKRKGEYVYTEEELRKAARLLEKGYSEKDVKETILFVRKQKKKYFSKEMKKAESTTKRQGSKKTGRPRVVDPFRFETHEAGWGGDNFLTDWEVDTILVTAIDSFNRAYNDAASKEGYYCDDPRAKSYPEQIRIHAKDCVAELNSAIAENGRYRTAYRINKRAYSYNAACQRYIYDPYMGSKAYEGWGGAWKDVLEILYTAITGENFKYSKYYKDFKAMPKIEEPDEFFYEE